MKCKARVKEKFVYRNGKIRKEYKKGQILEGDLDQTGPVKKFICGKCFFPLFRFDQLTVVIKDADMTVDELADMMDSPAGRKKLMGFS